MPTTQSQRHRGRPKGARSRVPVALDQRLTVRVDEAAAIVGCGVSKMKMWIADGTVESTKLGSMRFVKIESLRKLVGV
jgi:excisionase family DNA binding protein